MVIKRDGFRNQPPEVKSKWADWLSCFLESSPEATVEEYLRWCRETFPLSEYRTRLAKRVEKNPRFKWIISVHRSCLGVHSKALRSMSAKQLRKSDIFQLREEPWYPQLVLDDCKRFFLSPAWRDFVESHVLFEEGSAGHALLQTALVDYGISGDTGLVTIAFAIDLYVDMDEIKRAASWAVAEGQRYLHGVAGSKLRSLEFYELDLRYLFFELADRYKKGYNEIIAMVKRCQRTGIIDPTIRRVYPHKTEEEIAKFLRGLTSYDLSYEGVHSAVRHTRDSFAKQVRELRVLAGEF